MWEETMRIIEQTELFVDAKNRACKEIHNCILSFTGGFDVPLQKVRSLDWHYPSHNELLSILFSQDQQHVYGYSTHIQAQLPRIIELLSHDAYTRKAIITFPHEDARLHITPSLIAFHFKIRAKKLFVTVTARSIELFIGFPANLYQASAIARHVAEKLSIPVAQIDFFIHNAHLYEQFSSYRQKILRE